MNTIGKNKLKLMKTIAILLLIALSSIGITATIHKIYQKSKTYDVQEYNASFAVGNVLGLSADTDTLNFGIVYPGGSSTREINIYHEYHKSLKVVVSYSGNISSVLMPVAPFFLEPGTGKIISIVAHSPSNKYESFVGKVIITLLKT